MRIFILIAPIFLIFSPPKIAAQKQQKGKYVLSVLDSMQQNPSAQLTFYWWDPYHLVTKKKVMDPLGVKDETYYAHPPPYTYRFKLKNGPQRVSILSCFYDSVHIELNLQQDTTIHFQPLVKDFYEIVDSNTQILKKLQPGDLITIYVAKIFNDEREGIRLDLEIDRHLILLKRIDRKPLNELLPLQKQVKLETYIKKLEQTSSQLREPGENSYIVTIRKNRQVKEYKGRLNGAAVNRLLLKLKELLLEK